MNREFLESLGLEKEAINSIMAEHGKAVQAAKSELEDAHTTTETLQEQLKEREAVIKELEEDSISSEELDKVQNQLIEQRKEMEIRLGITKAGARNEKAVMALLDTEAIQVEGDGVKGIEEQIKKLQESDAYLFGTDKETVAPLKDVEPQVKSEDLELRTMLREINQTQ